MRDMRSGVMLVGTIVLAGCSTTAEPTSARLTPAAPNLSIASAGQRVTGSATILLPEFGNALERYSISAVRRGDGSVAGEFEEFSEQDGGQRIHANVVCFTVAGNSARLAAQIDQTNVPFGPVASYVMWSVIDNGEGARSAPDQTTDIFFGGTAAQADFHCRTGFNLAPYYSSFRGNLQVQ
jgi:hypothetical protein